MGENEKDRMKGTEKRGDTMTGKKGKKMEDGIQHVEGKVEVQRNGRRDRET